MEHSMFPNDQRVNDHMGNLADTALAGMARALGLEVPVRDPILDAEALAMIEEMRPSPGAFSPMEVLYKWGLAGHADVSEAYIAWRQFQQLSPQEQAQRTWEGLHQLLYGQTDIADGIARAQQHRAWPAAVGDTVGMVVEIPGVVQCENCGAVPHTHDGEQCLHLWMIGVMPEGTIYRCPNCPPELH